MSEYGYAGEILKVDLSDGRTTILRTSDYADKYMGGHGIATRLYWEMVPADAGVLNPENCLICASGPVTGFPGFAGFRWKICGKTLMDDPESFSYCNLGERWGAWLKYAGYDALVVQGKAEKPVYLYIEDGKVEIRDASHLWGMTTFDATDSLKAELGDRVSVLTIGPAAEKLIPYSIVLAEGGASGSGGIGVVMGSKNLKAVVVAPGDKRPVAADPDRVRQMVDCIRTLPRIPIPPLWSVPGLTRDHACYGCGIGCSRQIYDGEKGRRYKSLCQASDLYNDMTIRYYGEQTGKRLQATRLCDGYGLDTSVIQGMIEFLDHCYQQGILDEKQTGLPLSQIGGPEFIEELTRIITYREAFGEVLARGVIAAADEIGPSAKDILHLFVSTRGSEKKDYDPRLLITTAISYATEPRRPIQQLHEICSIAMMWLGMDSDSKPGEMFPVDDLQRYAEKVWGNPAAADFSTYEGKALAAKRIQDRVFAKESMVICDLRWTMTQVDRVLGRTGDTVTENQVYSAITGKETDDSEFARIGERIFNLQRAVLLRQGWQGRQGDRLLDYFFTEPIKKNETFMSPECIMPGKDGQAISKLGAVVDRDKFEGMKGEYYELRGWDVETGLPTRAKLEELQLHDVADDLAGRGLLKINDSR
jgi:aldehyde:ferredoxin oxidoreductase